MGDIMDVLLKVRMGELQGSDLNTLDLQGSHVLLGKVSFLGTANPIVDILAFEYENLAASLTDAQLTPRGGTATKTFVMPRPGRFVAMAVRSNAAFTGGTLQVETATATGSCSQTGIATVTVTAAGMTNSGSALNVSVADTDTTPTLIATKIREVLAANVDVLAMFTVGGTGADITLTKKAAAANDATLNIAIATGTATGVDTVASSANTTPGVANAGTAVFKVRKNSTDVVGLTATLDSGHQAATDDVPAQTFVAGDSVDIVVTTGGTFTPTTADIDASLLVLFEI